MIPEFELIKRLKRKIPRKMQGPKPGIGDDAAVLPGAGSEAWLLTTDAVVDGVDFQLGRIKPQDAGRKALAVNLSDIAAMGGEPAAFVAAIGIPAGFSAAWVEKCYDGMVRLARQYKVLFVGGDVSRSRTFFISIALLGRAPRREVVLRSGAKAGDWIAVTGRLGGSIHGRHYSFEPRVREARFLARNFKPTAMIDISDGLAQDLGHVLKASRKGAQIDLNSIPVSAAAKGLKGALSDGEDFELLFTIPASRKKPLQRRWKRQFPRLRLSFIGRVTHGKQIEWKLNGKKTAAPARAGFQHFRKS